jgi:hypothetical protein
LVATTALRLRHHEGSILAVAMGDRPLRLKVFCNADSKPMLAVEAKKRQATSTGGKRPQLMAKLPQAEKGRARDQAAKLVHVAPSNTLRHSAPHGTKGCGTVPTPFGLDLPRKSDRSAGRSHQAKESDNAEKAGARPASDQPDARIARHGTEPRKLERVLQQRERERVRSSDNSRRTACGRTRRQLARWHPPWLPKAAARWCSR